eukprot:10437347-Heterocapsa_arctica.AAC.1
MTELAVNDSWCDDHSVFPPRWEEAPGANPDEADVIDLLTWETLLEPGETIWVAIAAGGAVHMGGAGENASIPMPYPCWAKIHAPQEGEARSAD